MTSKSNSSTRSDHPDLGRLQPPRDPEAAIREEYELAKAQRTTGALELFIKRHPGHPLATEASKTLRDLRRSHAR
jgi:hypothetical protein